MVQTSEFDVAISLCEERKYKEALEILERLANGGDGFACGHLAVMYGAGEGVDLDYAKSRELDLKAVELGYTSSYFNLGVTCRATGQCREARDWFGKSARAGDDEALVELAKLLDVSDLEQQEVVRLLELASKSRNITSDARDEARLMLKQVRKRIAESPSSPSTSSQ